MKKWLCETLLNSQYFDIKFLICSFYVVDTSEGPKAPFKMLKSINSSDSEAIEILIWALAKAHLMGRWQPALTETFAWGSEDLIRCLVLNNLQSPECCTVLLRRAELSFNHFCTFHKWIVGNLHGTWTVMGTGLPVSQCCLYLYS